jgi:hypothetical protein
MRSQMPFSNHAITVMQLVLDVAAHHCKNNRVDAAVFSATFTSIRDGL